VGFFAETGAEAASKDHGFHGWVVVTVQSRKGLTAPGIF
jgi:hypothetical protein